jgi:hypothetical protein
MNGICAKHLRLKLIRPILQKYRLWSEAAENLLMITAAHESHGGHWLVQLNGGPARGIYQMEPRTYLDIRKLVVPNPKIQLDFDFPVDPTCLVWDLRLATVATRLAYWRHPEPLPKSTDILRLVRYYKKYYNSILGKATIAEVENNYFEYIS